MRIAVIHNIISPYKVYLFNEMNKVLDDFFVIFAALSEGKREWKVNRKELEFNHTILFEGELENANKVKLNINLINKLKEINPDVLIIDGYSYFFCWTSMFWGKLKRKKLILWFSSNYEDRKRPFYKELLKSFFIKRFDTANTYGIKSKEYLVSLGFSSSKIFITGNVTDNNFYSRECQKYKKINEEIKKEFNLAKHNFLYVGRFSPEKNIFLLLNVFKELLLEMRDINWNLILVGSGPQEEKIKHFIRSQNLAKFIHVIGFKQKEEICKFYSVSDVLILPSITEPWGLVVNEAMACGLAVLVSKNCGCYPDIVKDGINGFSFSPYNAEELKELMIKIASGRVDLKTMKLNSLKIIEKYNPKTAAQIILKTIKAIYEK